MKYVYTKLLIASLLLAINTDAKIDLDFSHKRGYYNNSFQLTLVADKPNTIIKYTTNNSKPSAVNGNTYNNPININSTATIKVYAYSATDESDVRAHSYLFINDILADSNLSSHVTADPDYSSLMETSFKALPIVSLSSNLVNEGTNTNIESETTAELFFPDGSRNGFMISCGLQTWGGSPTNPKKHFRLEFKKIYGEGKLKYKLFKEDNYNTTKYKIAPTDEFDKLLLRGGSQDALNAEYGHETYAQYVRNRVLMDVQIEMGFNSPHGRFVHVFLNGAYVGQYHFMERPDAHWFASYYGGDETDYEVYKSGEYLDNDNGIWDDLPNQVNLSTATTIAQTNNHIDLKQTAAYLNIMSYASGFDWSFDQNCLAGGNITSGNGAYQFIIWDVDFSIGNGGKWSPNFAYNLDFFDAPLNDDGPVPDNLIGNIEFKTMMDDNLECSCYNEGILSPAKIDSLYMHRINQILTSLIAESARWGNESFSFSEGHVSDGNWDVNGEFTTELNRIRNVFLAQRTDEMIAYYETNGLSSYLNGVVFNKYGGLVDDNFLLLLSNPNSNSQIYYTTDGTDPRAVGGSISNNAILYSNSINLQNGITNIKARVRNNSNGNSNINKWSAMCPRKFYVGQNYSDLIINEIHYNPADSFYFNTATGLMDTVSGTSFEFIELKNIGTEAINLEDVSFTKGVTAKFETAAILNPNDFVVIAENSFWFQQKYGFLPDATYLGKLSNSGESIELIDPIGQVIDSLSFTDTAPWDSIPDDGQYSLALIANSMDNNNPANWKAQAIFVTPNAENKHCPGEIFNNYVINSPSCIGANDGSILTNVSGGNGGPYNYLWNDGSTAGLQFGITAGNYMVEITDNSKCFRSDTIVLNDPSEILVNQNVTDQFYFNTADASANINIVSGGTAPFTYLWNNGNTLNSINNVNPGLYNVEITDANNCTVNEIVTILAVDCSSLNVAISKTDETTFEANDGTAFPIVSGGFAPYNYLWNNGSNNANQNNLSPGIYDITVTDNRGCEIDNTVEIIPYNCNGLTINLNISNQSYYNINNGAANVIVTNGIAPFNYLWSNSETTQSINQLAPGNYSIVLTANDNCVITESFTIDSVSCNALNINETVNTETCFGNIDGSINSNVSGGNPPFSYVWSNGSTNTNILNLVANQYTLTVTDQIGCETFKTITVAGPQSALTLDAIITPISAIGNTDGAIDLTVNGGVAPFTYFWANTANTQDLNNLSIGNYWVIVNDFNGCNSTANYNIENPTTNFCETASVINVINPTENGVTLFWTANANASNYELSYSVVGTNIWITSLETSNLKILYNLDNCTDYEIRIVTNCNNAGTSDASETVNFSTIGCDYCDPISNLGAINETEQSAILQWDLVSNATYTLFTRELGNANWYQNELNFPFAILFTLNACTTYEWYVIINCDNALTSTPSIFKQFTTLCP